MARFQQTFKKTHPHPQSFTGPSPMQGGTTAALCSFGLRWLDAALAVPFVLSARPTYQLPILLSEPLRLGQLAHFHILRLAKFDGLTARRRLSSSTTAVIIARAAKLGKHRFRYETRARNPNARRTLCSGKRRFSAP
jgi:hypothetical protein